ncbi:MAG: EAL domain-containing protein [Burkholderiaceae bacterium]
MNRLLKRQIRRFLGEDYASNPAYSDSRLDDFLAAVEQSYEFNQKELQLLERTLEINSDELNTANLQLKEQNEAISKLATRDTLTGLANRLACHERVSLALKHSRRYNRQFSLLFIDLDRFKRINDTLGHHIGDELLIQVARRLTENVRETDMVSRLGGDEFTVLLEMIELPQTAQAIGTKLLRELSRPYLIEGRELNITASIGIGLYPTDGVDVVEIFKNADTAMYHVKDNGRNNVQVYDPGMHENAMQDLELETSLRKAITQNELSIHYQPKLDVASRRLSGMEALLRWTSSAHGSVSPGTFIPIAESSGLIISLGAWVIYNACMQNAAWQRKGLRPMSVAVNISSMQLAHESFIDSIDRALEDSGLPSRYLELEITESMIMRTDDMVIGNIAHLKNRGIMLSIDDFGTGYSSLSAIKKYPIDSLKIDQSFVRDVASDPDDAAIVTAIIAMSQSLNLNVIAEGVETAEQLACMTREGCNVIQGYLISRPLPAEAFEQLLADDPDYTELLACDDSLPTVRGREAEVVSSR